MAEIINLQKARKAKLREAEAAEAAVNRSRHGRNAAERRLDQLLAERARRALDASRREDS